MRRRPIASGPAQVAADSSDRQFITALARGLGVLRSLAQAGKPLSNAELAHRTGLPKATITRVTFTLSALGYVTYNPSDSLYSIGVAAISLGYGTLAGNVVQHVSRPHMRALSDELGLSVALGTRDGLEMVYLANELHSGIVVMRLHPGSTIPMLTTAMGHAYLCALANTEREKLLAEFAADGRSLSPSIVKLIGTSLDSYARRGFCVVGGVWNEHINAVGASLTLPGEGRTVSFTCSALKSELSPDRLESRVGPALKTMVDGIARDMSGVTGPGSLRPYEAAGIGSVI